MTPRSLRTILLSLFLIAPILPTAGRGLLAQEGSTYEAETLRWRQDREASLKADNGWLTVAGLFFLNAGSNRFGSDPLDDIVLPAGSVPPHAGVFEFANGATKVRLSDGVTAAVNGKTVREPSELRPAGDETPADVLTIGDLTMVVHRSGERYAIRVRDKDSRIRREFTGLRWYPIKAEYRVMGTFKPYAAPKPVEVPNILGDLEKYKAPGLVSFTLDGQEHAIEPFLSTGADGATRLFVIFRDMTAGAETYPAARFLYADMPVNGQVVLDFNRAYNPPCAFNPYTTCPLPPLQNRLRVRIEAGELMYGHH